MKPANKLFLFITTLFLVPSLWAWTPKGHILIAEIAYENLTPRDQVALTKAADVIAAQLPTQQKQIWQKSYPTKHFFTLLAALPDAWRDQSLQEIFAMFHAKLPPLLKPYANDTTNSWHYIDLPPNNSNCFYKKEKTVPWAIQLFTAAEKQSTDPNAKALCLVFLAHFIGDLYQPLHSFSQYTRSCKNDLGGNDFLVYSGKNPMKLHALWDKGVGYFFHKINYAKEAARIQKQFPKIDFAQQLHEKNPFSWAQQNLQYAPFVYSISQNTRVPGWYYHQGQQLVKKQIALAGYQLAGTLTTLLAPDESSHQKKN